MDQRPQVGAATIISKDGKVLLMKRKGPHGTGTESTPGGHLDLGETIEACAAREAREKVGVEATDLHFRAVTNDVFQETGKHYITVWMEAGSFSGEPIIASDREASEIGWFAWDALPRPLFLPLENLVKANSYPPK